MKIKLLLFVLSLISLSTYSQISSGSFSVGGSSASYYPVLFSVSGVDGLSSLGKLSVYIDNVHANGTWSGSFHSDIEFISSNWGHIPTKIVEFTYVTGAGDAYRDPIGDIIDGSTQAGGSQLVMWLKGAATYQWSTTLNSRVTLIDGNPEGTTKTSFSGGALNILTAQSELVVKAKNAKFYQSVGLGTSGNGYFGGNVGIGTTSPQYKLDINGNAQFNGMFGCELSDMFTYKNTAVPHYGFRWNQDDWYSGGHTMLLSSYGGFKLFTSGAPRFFITANGNVGIKTENPRYELDVLGTIRAKEVLVNLDGGADFVFEKGYKLPTIEHVATYVQENKHLPDIPSANEMTKNGVSMGDMQVKLLQKVEEQTLYIVGLNNELQILKKQIKELQGNK